MQKRIFLYPVFAMAVAWFISDDPERWRNLVGWALGQT